MVLDGGLFLMLAEAPAQDPLWAMMPMMGMLLIVFFVIVVLPQQREQKREKQKRDTMLDNLKKNDRVVTIGGMIGAIANVSNDKKEFTLKVDENTRIKFVRSGISHKLDDDAPKDDLPKPAAT